MGGMDPELSAMIAALTRLDLDASRARLEAAAGGTKEDVAIMLAASALEGNPM